MEKESRNIDSVLKLQIKFIKEYTHKFDGLTMTHSFRGKNKMGALVLNSFKFYFDSSLTKVTNQENLNK